jgi:hypothetical protein
MSIERIFYCDWRECENNVQTARLRPEVGIITITEEPGHSLHFCSWDCVLKHAAEKPPVEVIGLDAA